MYSKKIIFFLLGKINLKANYVLHPRLLNRENLFWLEPQENYLFLLGKINLIANDFSQSSERNSYLLGPRADFKNCH